MKDIENLPVFIINMENRKDRKEHMTNLMTDIGVKKFTFIIPHKANKDTIDRISRQIKSDKIKFTPTKASHCLTYLDILDNEENDDILILEDDIKTIYSNQETKTLMNYIINNHPQDADMIYFEMCYENCNLVKNDNDSFFKLKNPQCAAAIYYPSKKSRQKVTNYFRNNESKCSTGDIDHFFKCVIKNKKINAYTYRILFVQDENFGSDLEGSVGFGQKKKPILPICGKQIDANILNRHLSTKMSNLYKIPDENKDMSNNIIIVDIILLVLFGFSLFLLKRSKF